MFVPVSGVWAARTTVRPLPCMDPYVTSQVGLVSEGTLATERTWVAEGNQAGRLLKRVKRLN